MKSYTVYIKRDKEGTIIGMEYIPEDFTIPGFIFNGIWLAYQKLWRPFFAFIAIILLLQQMEMGDIITSKISSIVLLGFSFYIGFSGRDMIRRKLERMGYELHDVVIAESEMEAALKYLTGNFIVNENGN